MRRLSPLLLVVLLLAACNGSGPSPEPAAAPDIASMRIIDLTHAFDAETIFWPTEEGFQRETTADGMTPGGYYYAAGSMRLAEHGGTHLDAPIHFAKGRHAVDEIPLDRFIGAGVVIDVSARALEDPDYQVTVADLQEWEERRGEIADGSILLLSTGYSRFWPDRSRYMGTDERGAEAVALLHFPGLDPQAAEWLVANRSIKAIGIDTPSIDYGQSQLFESHRILFEQNIPAFENVALGDLPEADFTVIALPMKIAGGSGGPLRIVALVP